MVVRRTLKLAVWVLLSSLVSLAYGAEPEVLTKAREHLKRGEAKEAGALYQQIEPGSPLWSERLTDTIRYHLLNKHPLEAWRLTELASRMSTHVQDLPYYRALSATQGHVCTLHTRDQPWPWIRLMEAHIYRFPSRFQQVGYRADAYGAADRGVLQHHLDEEQTQLLADIPGAVLLQGTGCSWLADRLVDRANAGHFEYLNLKAWFEARLVATSSDVSIGGEQAVELRLLELAAKEKDQELQRQVLARYANLSAAAWLALPEQERRFIWQQLVLAEVLAKPPYDPKAKELALVKAVALGLNTPEAGEWLALLAWEDLAGTDREQLVAHALKIPDMPHRGYLVALSAESAYRHGDMPAALAVVRRLLLLGEADGDNEVEAFATGIAGQIFAEYRYDEAMLGALQNSLPSTAWGAVFRRQLLLQALTGNGKGFDTLASSVTGSRLSNVKFKADELALLKALAHRQSAAFTQVIHDWERSARTSTHATSFLADLGAAVLQLNKNERRGVAGYLDTIAKLLKRQIGHGSGEGRLLELTRLFSGEPKDRYYEGGETVREGTVAVGVADLRGRIQLSFPFTWSPPSHLPLRDLLVQPKGVGDREWEIR